MKTAQKRQSIIRALQSLGDFIWIEDLYFLLREKGVQLSSRTVHHSVSDLAEKGLIDWQIDGRKHLVKWHQAA
jgi:Fe2+ or Zn2+ uptake regulation protein